MKGGGKLFIFAGVALALVAIVLGVASFSGRKTVAQTKPADAKVTVVQAAKDLPAHTVLAAADLLEVQISNADATDGVVTSAGSVIGQSYSVKLTSGQRLQTALIEVPGLANVIKPGLRAVALPVTSVSALGGLVQDGDYVDIVFHARINLVRIINSTIGRIPEDGLFPTDKNTGNAPQAPVEYPAVTEPGSVFQVKDGVGDDGQLEPVAKIVLQDVHILRVLAPGASFNSDGSIAQPTTTSDGAGVAQEKVGQIIIEVTSQQAELVTFIQDPKQTYQVIVRAKGDHKNVATTGITYEILVDNSTWGLPYPKSVTSPGGTPAAQTPSASAAAGNGGPAKGRGTASGNGANGSGV